MLRESSGNGGWRLLKKGEWGKEVSCQSSFKKADKEQTRREVTIWKRSYEQEEKDLGSSVNSKLRLKTTQEENIQAAHKLELSEELFSCSPGVHKRFVQGQDSSS